MINSVNSLPYVQGVNNAQCMNTNVTNPQTPAPNMVSNPNLGGSEALAAYNKPFVSTKPVKLQPTLATVMTSDGIKFLQQKGTPIKNSAGELDSIVVKNEQTTTVYTMDVLAPNDAIRKIETFDNTTGKLLSRQENLNKIEPGKNPQITATDIENYDPETGKVKSGTIYENGKVLSTWENQTLPDGTERTYFANIDKNETFIIDKTENPNTETKTLFDQFGRVTEIVRKDLDNYTTEVTTFKDGHLIGKKEVTTQTPIENTTGKNPLNDPDLKPSAPVVINYDPKQVEGEKAYYSNGVLETIRTTTANGDVAHRFAPNGNLTGIDYDNGKKSIVFFDKYYCIKEETAPDIIKTTSFNEDGSMDVSVANLKDDTEKTVFYTKDGRLDGYMEFTKDSRLLMQYDKEGNLREVRYEDFKDAQ